MFFATTSDRRGRQRQRAVAETREAAAHRVFDLDPKAMMCCTAKAHRQPDGLLFNTGSGMIWHRREPDDGGPSDHWDCDDGYRIA